MDKNGSSAGRKERPEHIYYKEIDRFLQQSIEQKRDFLFDKLAFDQELRRLEHKYEVPYEALVSFIRNTHVIHVKKTAFQLKGNMNWYLNEYCNGKTIASLAKSANYPPYLFARLMVEHLTTIPKTEISQAVTNAAQAVTDPSILKSAYRHSEEATTAAITSPFSTRLAQELHQSATMDPLYGPRHDVARRMVGVEFEVVLEQELSATGIPFETEATLRALGTSRTPDVLLLTPVAVPVQGHRGGSTQSWRIINWIDSKALFGDVDTHQQSVIPQAESYLHRFGPGLVVYWFGHAPITLLNDLAGEIVIAGWELPEKFMLPTGKIIERKKRQALTLAES